MFKRRNTKVKVSPVTEEKTKPRLKLIAQPSLDWTSSNKAGVCGSSTFLSTTHSSQDRIVIIDEVDDNARIALIVEPGVPVRKRMSAFIDRYVVSISPSSSSSSSSSERSDDESDADGAAGGADVHGYGHGHGRTENASSGSAYGYFFVKNAESGVVDLLLRVKPLRGREQRTFYRDVTYFGIKVHCTGTTPFGS